MPLDECCANGFGLIGLVSGGVTVFCIIFGCGVGAGATVGITVCIGI